MIRSRTIAMIMLLMLVADTAIARKKAGRGIKPMSIEVADEAAVIIGGVKITLGQAIRQAVEKNYDILAGSYDVAMTDSMYKMFEGKYSPTLSVEGGGSYAKFPDSMSFFTGEESKSGNFSASFYQNFPSGTTVIAGLSHIYEDKKMSNTLDYVIPGMSSMMGPEKSHTPVLFLSVQQELLKNAFGYSEIKQHKILKNAAKMQKEAILFQLSMVVVGVIADYWAVVMNKEALENAELQVRETKKVRNITARNVRFGLAENYNLNYYNALLAGAEAQLAMVKQQYRDSLRNFLTTINLDENMDVTGTAVFSNKSREINTEAALKSAYTKRADYKNVLLNLENAKLGLQVESNGSLPSLTAEVNLSTMAQREGLDKAYGNIGTVKYPSIEGKLKLTYPLYNRAQITSERNARFKLKQAKIMLEKYRRKIKDDVISKVEGVSTSYELYIKAKKARTQSEIFYRRMLANLRKGRLNSALVKNGVDALVQTRQQELKALVYYNVSLLMFEVSKNELFEKYNIDVENYIPKDKK